MISFYSIISGEQWFFFSVTESEKKKPRGIFEISTCVRGAMIQCLDFMNIFDNIITLFTKNVKGQ